jgi:glycosyltransferase involved in cell wall biosynthesis
MKVVHLINGLGTGGAERSLAEMLPLLEERGVTVAVGCFYHRREGVHEEVAARHDVRVLPGPNRLAWLSQIRQLILSERPQLIHTSIFEADVLGRVAAWGTGIPVLSSFVTMAYDPSRFLDPNVNAVKLRAARAIDGWTARHLSSHFHAVTETVKRSAVEVFRIRPDRVTVIERGRDPSRLGEPGEDRRRRIREGLGVSSDAELVLSAGRQEYAKGYTHLLEALAPMVRSRPRLVALIAGRRGNATARLEELHARLGLGTRVRFMGHRGDVPDLLAAADVFAFPSIYEGFGGGAVEAMALGVPVVCCDLPTLRDVLEPGRTALFVTPGSPEDLRRALETVLDDPTLRRRLGARGREVFRERFTLSRSAERMAGLYRGVARVAESSKVRP